MITLTMNKLNKKHWMQGFSSKEEEMAYWEEEGKQYQAWLNSQKNIKAKRKVPFDYNPNDNTYNQDYSNVK